MDKVEIIGSRGIREAIKKNHIHFRLAVLNLAGFDRISLKPGQTKTVSFTAGPKQPAIWNRQMKPVIAPSSIDLFIGPDARHLENVTLEVDP